MANKKKPRKKPTQKEEEGKVKPKRRKTVRKKGKAKPRKPIKKVSRGHYGECTLQELPANTYFRTVNSKGLVSSKTYLKEKNSYDRSIRKYVVADCDDVYGYGKELKGSQKVTTAFDY